MFNPMGFCNIMATWYANELSWIFVLTPESHNHTKTNDCPLRAWMQAPHFFTKHHTTQPWPVWGIGIREGHWWSQFAQSQCGDAHLPHLSHWSVWWPTAFRCAFMSVVVHVTRRAHSDSAWPLTGIVVLGCRGSLPTESVRRWFPDWCLSASH